MHEEIRMACLAPTVQVIAGQMIAESAAASPWEEPISRFLWLAGQGPA